MSFFILQIKVFLKVCYDVQLLVPWFIFNSSTGNVLPVELLCPASITWGAGVVWLQGWGRAACWLVSWILLQLFLLLSFCAINVQLLNFHFKHFFLIYFVGNVDLDKVKCKINLVYICLININCSIRFPSFKILIWVAQYLLFNFNNCQSIHFLNFYSFSLTHIEVKMFPTTDFWGWLMNCTRIKNILLRELLKLLFQLNYCFIFQVYPVQASRG